MDRSQSPRLSVFLAQGSVRFTPGSEGECTLIAEEKHAFLFFMFDWFCLSLPTGIALIFPSPSSLSHSHFSCIPIFTPGLLAWSFRPGPHAVRVTGSSEQQYLCCMQFQPFPQTLPFFPAWLFIQPSNPLPTPSGIRCQAAALQPQRANPQLAVVKTETRFPLSFPATPFITVLWNTGK